MCNIRMLSLGEAKENSINTDEIKQTHKIIDVTMYCWKVL
ncbi:hypothetical protein ABID30_003528 [Enterococcus rotai]